MSDDECRHVEECDGCAYLYASCQAVTAGRACGALDVRRRRVHVIGAQWAETFLCPAHEFGSTPC